MDPVESLRAWSYHRQRLGTPARTAGEALRDVVAVYATHPTAPLALWARTRSLSPAAYRRLDRDRRALRIPGMRGTIFLVPRAAAAPVFTACRPPSSRVRRALKRHGFSMEDYERFAESILSAATEPVRAEDLQGVTGLKGLPLTTVVNCLRLEGRVVSLAGDGLNRGRLRYVATSAWAPEGLDAGDRSEALSWLAGEYVRGYGPARVEDFAWWAGVSGREARLTLELHDTIDIGDGLLLPAGDLPAFSQIEPPRGTVDLLPKWDAYTMGHAPDGRGRFVHPDVQDLVYTPIGPGLPGDGNPVVLVDGQAAATWTYTVKEGPRVQPFDGFGPAVRKEVDAGLAALARFLAG